MKNFYVKRMSDPPLVPLCRLVPTDAIRVANAEESKLIASFDRAAYVPTLGCFTVSLKGRHGETKSISEPMIEKWDPIWRRLNVEFESQCVREWEDLKGKLFFVWDGNHRLKTWMKRIEDGEFELFYHVFEFKKLTVVDYFFKLRSLF